MKNNQRINIQAYYLITFLIMLSFSGIILSLIINLIFGKFSFRLIEIAAVNSVFLSSGVIFIMVVFNLLFKKFSNIFIFILCFLIILGISLFGFIFVIILDPLFFFYESKFILSYLIINFLFIVSFSVIATGLMYFQNIMMEKQNALNEEKYLREIMENKLQASKINPHFLFNSLNLITSLLRQPKLAEKAIINLSELFRYSLQMHELDFIPIKKELDMAEKYLFIQKLRFKNRFDYEISNNVKSFNIPALIIQPLIENSIKHNINNTKKLNITISVYKEKNYKIISVYDSEKSVINDMIDKGTGLTVTRKRVELSGGIFIIEDGGILIKYKI